MEKSIRNVNAIAYKLGPALTRATNEKLEVARKERQKREEMVKGWKIKAITTRRQSAKGGISLSNKEEEN